MNKFNIRKLEEKYVHQFSNLILNMYSNLENLEWFSKMPFDEENILNIIKNKRFFIIGYFENENLAAVSCLDYKCGKILDQLDLDKKILTSKIVEIGFSIITIKFRNKGIMKLLLDQLLLKTKEDGFEYAFCKIHNENIPSLSSAKSKGFDVATSFEKKINKKDFLFFLSKDFTGKKAKENVKKTLEKFEEKELITVNYKILIKRL